MAEVKNTVFTLPATLPVVRHQLKFDSYIQTQQLLPYKSEPYQAGVITPGTESRI